MFKRKKRVMWILLMVLQIICSSVISASASVALIIPADQAVIKEKAYYGDTSLDAVILQEGILSIGAKAFAESSLTDISLPSSLTYIAPDAFDNVSLETVHAEKGSYAYQWMRDSGYIAEYRALLIGEQSFLWFADEEDPMGGYVLDDEDQRNVGDVRNITAALNNVIGPQGGYGKAGKAFQITQKINLSYSDIHNSIRHVFADTREQDISVFFIATHGHDEGDGELYTAFTGSFVDQDDVKDYWLHRLLSFETLASWLKDNIKGRVFIILESCGSGSSIYTEDIPENRKARWNSDNSSDAERFVEKAVEVFSKADPGVPSSQKNKTVPGLFRSTGDLRLPKFYVLAASAHHEKSWGWETGDAETSFNYFTKWLTEGIGNKEESPADTNKDSFLTLREMFTHIQQYDHITYHGVNYYQHVQRYPAESDDPLLKLEEPFVYTVTGVHGNPHTTGSNENIGISVSRNPRDDETYDRFESVFLDEFALEPDSYEKAKGSLLLTLKSDYLDTLSCEKHKVTIRFSDGEAETSIKIKAAKPAPTPTFTPQPIPVTGDSSHPALWLCVLLLGLSGLIVTGVLYTFERHRK